jgi:phosphoglycolate phosphatase
VSKLLLFDIDGTLLTTDNAGRHALELSFMECLGKDISRLDFSLCGKTDIGIITEILNKLEIKVSDELIEQIIYYYLEFLPYELEIADNSTVFEGVYELLIHLENDNSFKLALLTGNIEDGAYKKLDFFNLKSFFKTGGFGDDNEDRNKIFPIAYKRCCNLFGEQFKKENIIIIGDSIKDIECAKENNIKSLIVGTGLTDEEEILNMKPTSFISDFSDPHSVIEILKTL